MEAHIKRPVPARSSSHRSFRTTQSPREPAAAAAPPPSSPHRASPSQADQPSPRPLQSRPPLVLSLADSASRHRDRHLQHHQHTPPAQRAPSTTSSPLASGTPSSTRARRLSSSSTATRPTPSSVSSSGSYFGPHAPSSADARSPASRKPPASHSSHGIETSYGPPIALITRRRSNTSDVARRSQSPADVPQAQPQFSPFSSTEPAPAASHRHTRTTSDTTVKAHAHSGRRSSRSRSLPSSRATSPNPQTPARRSFSTSRGSAMANNSFSDSQSDYDFAYSHRSRPDDRSGDYARDAKGSSSEDLFLNIAQDSPRNPDGDDDTVKVERRRSRIARMSRQSLPANSLNSPATRPSIDTGIKTPTAIQTRLHSHIRRASNLPSPSYQSPLSAREPHSAVTASFPADGSRVRSFGMSSSGSFGLSSSRTRDQDESPPNRRSSIPDPSRAAAATRDAAARENRYRSSNLTYSSRYNQPTTPLESSPEILSKPEQQSRTSDGHDGSESLDSTTATSTVWDELDELKSRIKKLELTGKMPPTSGAAVTSYTDSQRPRTATTQATSVTASPKQLRKTSVSPPETTVSGAAVAGAAGSSHPLLHSALAKCKDTMNPSFYRMLEATATDALELAAITTNGGNQSSAVSNSGAPTSERQLRRKADNMCRSLTELCIALCDNSLTGKIQGLKSPGLAPPPSRRQSVQMNGERERDRDRDRERDQLPPRGGSAEPEGEMRNSPSRALNRIEARRTSMLATGSAGNSPRDGPDRDRTTPTQGSRYQQRAGTSLLNGRPRRATVNNDDQPDMEEETQSLRVPSRAMTDFAQNRQSHGNRSNRLSREYTSNVPLPDGASAVALQHATSARRPNGAVAANDSPTSHIPSSSSFLRERRYERMPAQESPRSSDGFGSEERRQRLSFYQNSTPRSVAPAATSGLGRTASLSRRLRQET